MPHLEISSEVSMYYEIVSSEPNNPWLLLIHPFISNFSVIKDFAEQPVIKSMFNCILFEMRYHGRTRAPLSAKLDRHTFATDLAMGMQKLQLPPVHVIAGQANTSEVALALAAIFPEKVLSIFLCGLGPDLYSEATEAAFHECIQCIVFPADQEQWEEGMNELHYIHFHEDTNVAREDEMRVIDEWTDILIKRYSPRKASLITALGMVEMGRQPTPQAFLDSLTQPLFICHGAASTVMTEAESFERYLTYPNLDLRSKFESIPGAPLVLLPLYTPLLTEKYVAWIRPILEDRGQTDPQPSISDFTKSLNRLATLYDKPSIADRDPFESSSYHVIDENSYEDREMKLAGVKMAEKEAILLPGEEAPESWTDASQDEKTPWRFTKRFEAQM
ncbi:hypothetical protein CROQUDRAFT_660531 [Cronartium quercuum f. sp. fusiforme G11]|uniref:AB hydrolase-1 domain-containing protein n=1 Tax=Cronartium quercuum f. sp. fusiforme G11 TaxID=708437 RepID=A0A9P6NDL0_9BASI|nr:hypothetical protein CROQUDRAFT_660531 [Cronartium quercuum f. sp. fusiforme G11]